MPSLNDAQKNELRKAADARLRRVFNTRKFSVENYRPPTGIGLFNTEYLPTPRLIKVRVKVWYNWQTATDDATYLPWTEADKSTFRTKAASTIKNAWSNRYKLVCEHPAFSDLSAAVDIQIRESSRAAAHYRVDVRKVPQNHSKAWSGGCTHGTTVWPFSADFSNWAVEERADFKGGEVFNFKVRQLQERLAERNLEMIPMAHGGAAISPDAIDRLYKFSQEAKKILGSDVTGIQCVIYGCSTESIGHKRADERANAIARLLQREVPNFFVVDRSKEAKTTAESIARKRGKKLSELSGALLFIHVPKTSNRSVPTNYIVITHEFGHMLGCPDEYYAVNCTGLRDLMRLDEVIPAVVRAQDPKLGTAIEPGRHFSTQKPTPETEKNQANEARRLNQQLAFASHIEQAGVSAPAFFGSGANMDQLDYMKIKKAYDSQLDDTRAKFGRDSDQYKKLKAADPLAGYKTQTGASDSIMFTGQKVFPAHYIPIWACLSSMTREFVDPTDWRIVPA